MRSAQALLVATCVFAAPWFSSACSGPHDDPAAEEIPVATPTSIPSPPPLPTPGGLVTSEPPPTPFAVSTPAAVTPALEQPEPRVTMHPEALEYQLTTELYPDSVAIDSRPGGDPRLAVGGHKVVSIFSGPDEEPIVSAPVGLGTNTAFVSSIVSFQGEFLVTVSDIENSSNVFPPLYRWDEAASKWDQLPVTVSQQAQHSALTHSALTQSTSMGVAAPPSPPWDGSAGVTHMAVHDDVLWATGWASVNDEIIASLWRTSNGVDWLLEPLPRIDEGNEYGVSIAATAQGMAVAIGNWTHFGAGIVGREHGGGWFDLPFPPDAGGTPRLIGGSSELLSVQQNRFDGPATLYQFTGAAFSNAAQRDAWRQLTFDGSSRLIQGWSPESSGGPIAWSEPQQGYANGFSSQWRAEPGDFFTGEAPGQFVTTTQGWTVLRDESRILLLPQS